MRTPLRFPIHKTIKKLEHCIFNAWTRKMYWNQRASDIDRKWGREKHDYVLLSRVISFVKPRRLLNFGCGSGRLFPLYNNLKIKEVIGQDVSSEALKIAEDRYHFPNVKTVKQGILETNFPSQSFDLVVSNCVMQHIAHNDIQIIITKLTDLGKNIYINEMSDSDYTGESFYSFRHSYVELFSECKYKVIQSGLLGKQRWFLFAKNSKESDES